MSNYIVYWKNALKYLRMVMLFNQPTKNIWPILHIIYLHFGRCSYGDSKPEGAGRLKPSLPHFWLKKKTFYEENSQFSLPG